MLSNLALWSKKGRYFQNPMLLNTQKQGCRLKGLLSDEFERISVSIMGLSQ